MSGRSRSSKRSGKSRSGRKLKRVKPRLEKEPAWFAKALDEFGEVFRGPNAIPEEISNAFIVKWLGRCKTEREEEQFEEAFKSWLLIRQAVLQNEASRKQE